MPTYQYACTACGHRFEAVQSFSDASLTDCPECAGRLRKVFSAVGIVFKGSGFYRTDSRSGGSSANGEKSGTSESNESSGGKDGSPTGKERATKVASSSSTTSASSPSSTPAAAAS